jgi:hypothetical protein
MADYLEGYGVEDAKREKVIKRIALTVLIVLVAGLVLFFTLRNYQQKKQIRAFLSYLDQKDYQDAYRLWGCMPSSPCADYTLQKFMEDWGPTSGHSIASAKIDKVRSCSSGVIFILKFTSSDEVDLWVDRKQKNIGFAPWPICNPEKIPIQK